MANLNLNSYSPKYSSSEVALQRMRSKIFDYPEDKQAQADRVLAYLKSRKMRDRAEEVARRPFRHWMYAAED
ncbi:hypothetical protein [Geoalkalibacter halelectricus]|uniref:hypothetical protein n=1 Tax=Geoalkalibacter halelectricus TaxID=2847045 RepID=UPI00266F315E|nr:hypothetical protein [Geoalkalibacter halelectricus]MDO3380426.1 hypothetical protein [Geoalkalibacter halelectricus]